MLRACASVALNPTLNENAPEPLPVVSFLDMRNDGD